MNRISLILILLMACTWSAFGQSPQKFKFQAVARDASNNPYTSANLAVRISLVRDGVSGLIDYSERHEVTTSPVGVFDLEIGGGVAVTGNFSNADWAMHPYYLKVDIDPNGGTNYVNLGTSQLLSVPYAIYAGQAGNGNGNGGDPTDELQNLIYDPATQTLTLTDGNTVTLTFPGGSDNQSLSFNSTTSELTISNGNTITIPAGNGQVGPQGPAGVAGATGPQGAQGTAGVAGPQGPQGVAGAGVQIVGSVANAAALNPNYTGSIGDMFISQNNGHGHVWNGNSWDDVGQIQGPAGSQGPAGMNGAAGAQGATGATGSAGATGPQGTPGVNGTAGATGPVGAQGPAGIAGSQGPQGVAGAGVQIVGSAANAAALDPAYTGATGDMFITQDDGHGHVWNGNSWDDVGQIQGPAGPQGSAGMNGAVGAQGATGATGPAGTTGPQGAPGVNGIAGATGPTGAQGPAGIAGPQGPQGTAGTGVQIVGSVANAAALNPAYGGATGDMFISQDNGHGHVWNGNSWDDVGQIQGPAGPQGMPGSDGAVGATGTTGAQGVAGSTGPTGAQGTSGAVGATGAQGAQGNTGPAGPQGSPGADGAVGATGAQGPQGNTGSAGSQGTPGADGAVGATGAQGPQGNTGPAGAQGSTGPQGATGPAGTYTAGSGINIAGDVISASGGGSPWTTSGSDIYYNTGKVGIGTSTPAAALHLGSGVLADPLLRLQGTDPWLAFHNQGDVLKGNLWYDMSNNRMVLSNNDVNGKIVFNVNFDDKMTITKDGNVGIGRPNPLAALDVAGNIFLRNDVPSIFFYNESDVFQGSFFSFNGELAINNANNDNILFQTNNGTTRATINSNGMTLKGDITVDDSTPAIQFYNGAAWHGYMYSDETDMIIGNIHNNSILLQTNATTKAEFDNEGLTLNGVGGSIEMKVTTTEGPIIKATTGGSSSEMRIASTGVSISETGGVNAGSYMLRVVEPGSFGLDLYNSASEHHWELYADGSGDLQLWADNTFRGSFNGTSGVYTAGSDERLKTNIHALENTLMGVLALKPSRYQYIDNNPNKEETIGFVAQEVQEIFPELVQTNTSDRLNNILSINYSGFGVIAVKAIQEQQLLIENLRSSLEEKEAILKQQQHQIDTLEARLSRLESLLDK